MKRIEALTMMVAVALAWLAACGDPRSEEAPPDEPALEGIWSVELRLDAPLLPGRTPRARTVRGELAILRSPLPPEGNWLPGGRTHAGSYALSLRPFGFEIAGALAPSTLVARQTGDSVQIVLQPERQSTVRLTGVRVGDSVAGRWSYYAHRGGSAEGRFVMRRSRP